MESDNCQWEGKNIIRCRSGPHVALSPNVPQLLPIRVRVCNSPFVESTATVRCYAITTSLINARRSGDSAQLIILGSQNDGVTILEIESTLTTLL